MKHWIFTLLFASSYLAATAQLLQEGFNTNSFPPSGWQNVLVSTGDNGTGDAPGGLFDWVATGTNPSTPPQSGAGMVRYRSFDFNVNSSAVLITPSLNFNIPNTVRVSFWMYRDNTFPNRDSINVLVNTTASLAGATTLGTVHLNINYTPQVNAVGWYNYSYTIPSNFTGTSNFILFQAVGRYGNNMFIDEVRVEALTDCNGTPSGGTALATGNYFCNSGTVNLSATGQSANTGITYQWQQSAAGANSYTNIANANSATLQTTATASTDYRLQVTCTNSNLSAFSTPVRVTVAQGAPANDAVCNAINLTLGGSFDCGNTTCATSGNDPVFSNSTPNNTVWYTYTPTTSGPANIRFRRPAGVTSGLLFGFLGIYTATGTCPSLTLTEVNTTLAFNLITNDSVLVTTPSLTAGTTYYLMVDGVSGGFGAYCIGLPILPPPSCVTNVSPANNATNVALPPTIQWNADAGATAYTIFWSANNGQTYDSLGNVNSLSAQINNTSPGTTYRWYIVPRSSVGVAQGCISNATSFTTIAGPANDNCANATALTSGVNVTGTTQNAGPSGVAVCSPAAGTPDDDVWYSFVAATDSVIITAAFSSGIDGVLGLYSGTCTNLNQLGSCADTSFSGQTEILRSGGLTAGTTYYVRVFGFGNGTGTGSFNIQYVSAFALPVILTDFTVRKATNGNILTWRTQQEQNNKGFAVQRSLNGRDFETLGFIRSSALGGNSNQVLSYNFTDAAVQGKAAYYRLVQTDLDGKTSLSEVRFVRGIVIDKLAIRQVIPNPISTQSAVWLTNQSGGTAQLLITTIDGRQVKSLVIPSSNDEQNIVAGFHTLQSGVYFIQLITTDGLRSNVVQVVKP